MIALDTNVIVRFLVEDDKAQSRQAKRLIESVVNRDDKVFLSDLVMVETVWVLSRSYGFDRMEIAEALRMVLSAKNIEFESSDRLAKALRSYVEGRAGFSDYLIREIALEHNCEHVATFDKRLLKDEGFEKP